jgi:hydrazine synthase alpha subunit-like protein
VRWFAIGILLLAIAAFTMWDGVSAQSGRDKAPPATVYTSAPTYLGEAWLKGGERFPAGAQIMLRAGGVSRVLVTGFAASADPSVSFDGTRILFAGRREAKDPWQVWEVAVAAGAAKRITTCPGDCVKPFYLPGNRVVYARKLNGRFVLEADSLDGTTPVQLTYAPGNALPTDVLRDGRILFEASYPLGAGAWPEVYTVYSDGSGVEAYRCDHGARRQAGKQMVSGDIVFASGNGIGRFTSALAHEVAMKAPAGEFAGDIAAVSANDYLVAWRRDAETRYSVQLWNPETNTLAPQIASSDADAVQPVLVAPRPLPKQHPSGLHDWDYANLLCLNAYTSKYSFAADSVAAVKLYATNEKGQAKLLGSSVVEPDGSFYVRVPADQPLQIELLDRQGKTLKRERGWWWMRKGEQRICVGCHAGPERAPENAVPAVLVKSTTPVSLTGTSTNKGGR